MYKNFLSTPTFPLKVNEYVNEYSSAGIFRLIALRIYEYAIIL